MGLARRLSLFKSVVFGVLTRLKQATGMFHVSGCTGAVTESTAGDGAVYRTASGSLNGRLIHENRIVDVAFDSAM